MMANEKIDLTSNGNEISVIESDDVEYNGSGPERMPAQFDSSRQSILEVGSPRNRLRHLKELTFLAAIHQFVFCCLLQRHNTHIMGDFRSYFPICLVEWRSSINGVRLHSGWFRSERRSIFHGRTCLQVDASRLIIIFTFADALQRSHCWCTISMVCKLRTFRAKVLGSTPRYATLPP